MTRRIFCKVILVVVAIFGLLVLSNVLLAQGNSENAFDRVREVQERHTNWLMAINGVEGTAIGFNLNERLAIKVFAAGPEVPDIPKTLDGVPVQVLVTGKFYALEPGKGQRGPPDGKGPGGGGGGDKGDKVDPTGWFPRPIPIGVSTGNVGENSAGTIACRVKKGNDVYALSNNHVYALENTASIHSNVLQPGRYDGGDPSTDVIGTLADFMPISFDGSGNTIDAAIAVSTTDELGNATPSDGYGTPDSITVEPTLVPTQFVQKYGRTTSLTKGTITHINAIVDVGYSSGTARFVDQIIVQARRPFIKAGDSGSLLVTDPGKNPVGLLFAGNLNGKLAIANPIDAVLSSFGVTIDSE